MTRTRSIHDRFDARGMTSDEVVAAIEDVQYRRRAGLPVSRTRSARRAPSIHHRFDPAGRSKDELVEVLEDELYEARRGR